MGLTLTGFYTVYKYLQATMYITYSCTPTRHYLRRRRISQLLTFFQFPPSPPFAWLKRLQVQLGVGRKAGELAIGHVSRKSSCLHPASSSRQTTASESSFLVFSHFLCQFLGSLATRQGWQRGEKHSGNCSFGPKLKIKEGVRTGGVYFVN